MLRERFSADLKEAIKAKDARRVSTLRLISAAIKDRDIAARTTDNVEGVSDSDILGILGKMIRQRQESARIYEEAGRLELAEQERDEIGVIQRYLPKPMSEAEAAQAIRKAIDELGATSIRDMGRIMAHLKERHTGRMDFAKAGAVIKESFR
jgi:uncharacterized protein YqeY